jgi:CRISPR-associated protein Cas1
MSTLYLTEQYSTLHLDDEVLILKISEHQESGRKAEKKRVPLGKISQVVVLGNITVTTPAIQALLAQGSNICYLTAYGTYVGHVLGDEHKHGNLRLLQNRAHDEPSARLIIAKACVRAKLHNQRTLLLRANRSRDSRFIAEQAEHIKKCIDQVNELPDEDCEPPNPSRPQADTILGKLMGIEGAAAAAYFPAYGALFNGEWEDVFTGRHKRPPTDPINALLSYGYVLLNSQAMSAAHIVGFDPYIGFLHSTGYGKPALSLDIIEMFRAPIVDSVVLSVLNNRSLKIHDFEETLGTWRMSDDARRLFLQKFEERLSETIKHPIFKTKVTYRRCLELQLRLLSRCLLGELKQFREFHSR